MWNKELVQSCKRGRVFIISAPAGAGKTTLVKKLLSAFPNVVQAPSLTTRPPRKDEVEGHDYHFVSKEEFLAREAKGELLEHVELHGQLYGTSKREIERLQASGHHVVLVLDTRGALAVRQLLPAVLIFVKPPSLDALRDRLYQRASEDEAMVEKRLVWAKKELADENHFDYSIVNDDLTTAFHLLASIVIAESHKTMLKRGSSC